MPWSSFHYKRHWIEMRDSRLSDLIAFLAKTVDDFTASRASDTQLEWLSKAVESWQGECDLPPGCKMIKLDQWLYERNRIDIFCAFIDHVVEMLKSEVPPDSVLAEEAVRLRLLVTELRGEVWVE